MAMESLPCLLLVLALIPMGESCTCYVGNERDPDKNMDWMTSTGDDPCDCSMLQLGGFNSVPVLHGSNKPVIRKKYPVTSNDQEVVKRHVECDQPSTPPPNASPMSTDVSVTSATNVTSDANMTSAANLTSDVNVTSPLDGWVQVLHFDRENPSMAEVNLTVLNQWESLGISKINISFGGIDQVIQPMDLVFNASGSNSTSWFAYNRIQSSPWNDLAANATFILNWTAKSEEILGIHGELRGIIPVDGWLRCDPPAVEAPDSPAVIALGKTGKTSWIDRELLSRGRQVGQSSVAKPGLGQYGVDRNSTTRTSTAYEFEPWWMVDLGDGYEVYEVTITPCDVGKGKTEVTGAQLRVGDTLNIDGGNLCGSPISLPATEGGSVTVECGEGESDQLENDQGENDQGGDDQGDNGPSTNNQLPYGRYLSMRIDGNYGVLGFCGILILIDVDVDGFDNEPVGNPTWQSSILVYNASLSVDGLLGVHGEDMTCSQTSETGPELSLANWLPDDSYNGKAWWVVDLQDTMNVSMIRISPFPDLQKWISMAGAVIYISKVDGEVVSSAYIAGISFCGEISSHGLNENRPLLVQCNTTASGRFVAILNPSGGPIAMCEFEVFGEKLGNVVNADTLSIQAFIDKHDGNPVTDPSPK